MRRCLPALLAPAILAVLAAPAAAQPSPAADRARECSALADASVKASKATLAMADELAMLKLVERFQSNAQAAVSATSAQLGSMLTASNNSIRYLRQQSQDLGRKPEDRAKSRHMILLLERWIEVLQRFQAARLLGETIDPNDNGLTRWRDKARRRIPKLTAALPGAQAAARAAVLEYQRCLARATVATAPATERLYLTNLGDVKLTTRGAVVTGTYQVQSSVRFANGVSPVNDQIAAKLEGRRSGDVVEGYWYQAGGSDRCPTSRNGFPSWGRFRWEFKPGGFWMGRRGVCDGPLDRPWDGQPKR